MRNQQKIWPNFFIIGEPRSGTTTLHDLLSKHPEIFMSKVKEPHYFSDVRFNSPDDKILRITRKKDKYLELFKGSEKYAMRGESSTFYLADPVAPERIKESVPDAKMIAVLRDPIERAFSHYLLQSRRGKQKESFLETVKSNLNSTTKNNKNSYNLIVELGRYHKHISRYLSLFDKSQLHIILFDDLKERPQEVLKEVFSFLKIDPKPSEHIQLTKASNPYSRPRNKLFGWLLKSDALSRLGLKMIPRTLLQKFRYKVLLKSDNKPTIDATAKEILIEEYEPEIEKLEKLLGLNLDTLKSSWRK